MWIIVVGYGFSAVWAYAMTPGSAATAAAHWPGTSFSFDRARPNPITVLHPESSAPRPHSKKCRD